MSMTRTKTVGSDYLDGWYDGEANMLTKVRISLSTESRCKELNAEDMFKILDDLREELIKTIKEEMQNA